MAKTNNAIMTKRRICPFGTLIHCYQRTVGGCLAFYSVSDYLVFFTIICIVAARYNVRIVKICIMPDHFHVSVICYSVEDLSAFMRDATSCYAKAFNRRCNRTGPLFCEQFGSAPKKTDKHVRTNMIYVDNNPVERKLCSKAEDYRWNFLAFTNTRWPFSEPGIRRHYSGAMKRAVATVLARHKSGKYITFDMLQNAFAKLSRKECNQLADFIINTYNVIDYEESLNHFGSYESMLLAIHSTTGSEYDLKEHFNGKRDDVYAKLTQILLKQGLVNEIQEVVSLPLERKLYLQRLLTGKTLATANQIACFLHLPAQS